MALDLNFDGVGDSPPYLEEGDYVFVIADVQNKPSKSDPSGPKVLHVTLEAQDVKVRTFFSQKKDSLWALKQFLQSVMGQELDGPINIDEKELIGMTVVATVSVQDRTDRPGVKQNNIVAYKMPD